MSSEEDDSLLDGLELDDLAGLAAELEALREELGEEYVQVQLESRDHPAGDGEDEESVPPLPPLPPLPGTRAAPSGAAAEGEAGRTLQVESESEDDGDAQEGVEESEAEEEPEAAAALEEDEAGEAANMIAAALKPLPRWAAQAAHSRQTEPSATAAPALPGSAKVGAPAVRQQLPAAAQGTQPAAAAAGKGQKGAKSKASQPRQQAKEQKQQRGKEKPGRRRRSTKAELAAEAQAALAAAEAEAEAAAAAAQTTSKVEAVRSALEANRQLQGRLRRLLASTDRAIDRNAALQQQVRALHARKNAGPTVATVPLTSGDWPAAELPIGTSQFWGAGAGGGGHGGQQLPPYPDADTLRPLFKYLPFSFRSGRWSEEEQQRLREGVLQLVQEVQLHEVMQEMQQRLESGGAVSLADLEASKQRIAGLALDSPVVCQLAAGFREDDWARLVQRTRLHRSTTECRLQWANCLSPSLSQQPWSREEDAHLQTLVQQYSQRQWDAVSRDLAALRGGGVRPPLSCLQRHQQLVMAAAKESRQFEAQEGIARLSVLVAKHGGSWKRIAEEFGGGWEADQLMHIWRRHAQRGAQARRGKWSQGEDDALLKAMALHGRKWSLVAKLVPGRTDVQCRERYMNVLNPEVTAWQPWGKAEEQELLELAQEHTQEDGRVKWSAVAAHLPGRTDKQCATRWKALTSGQASKPKKRKAGGEGGGKGKGRKQRRSASASAGNADGGEQDQEAGEAQADACEQREHGPGEPAAAAEQDQAPAVPVSQRPQRKRRQRRFDSETDGEDQHRLDAAAAAAAAEGASPTAAAPATEPELLPAPPAPTSDVMPCSPSEAVGQLVGVWWVEDEASGAGRMYRGRITAWAARLRAHSVRYAGETRALRCQLAEETVEWLDAAAEAAEAGELDPGARLITGPGTPWPGAATTEPAAGAMADHAGGAGQEPTQQTRQQAELPERQEEQHQAQGGPQNEQQAQRPVRRRRPSARAAALAGEA